jgi:dsDNA-specific endonuclease/ATPase MutS2
MDLTVGAEVVVTSLGKRGRIVEASAGGRYRVAVGTWTTWCTAGDLESVSHAKKRARRESAPQAPPVATPMAPAGLSAAERRALGSLDLHGLTVAEALQMLGRRVDEAIRAGLDRLEIIHGISGGRLRAAVHGYLAGTPSVVRFVPDPHNPGVTWAYF